MTRAFDKFRVACLAAAVLGLAQAALQAGVIAPADQRFGTDSVQEVPSLQRHVLPLMGRLGCNGRACHGSFQGQGGFRLSLFGYDFKMDHEALTSGDSPRVDVKNPRESLILQKPIAKDEDEHGGGHRMDVDSWQYRLIQRWIEAGAKPVDEEKEPKFVRLEVSPLEIVFKNPGDTAQLRVISHWSDGTAEDVTPLCRFTTNDDAVAKVDLSGRITVTGKGDTHVVAFYDNGVVPVAVLLPVSDQIGPKYPSVPTPTKVDELVVAKLRKLGMVPSGVSTDAEFLRRASLDITGMLPAPDEVTRFLADTDPHKRTKKIDELLDRPAYAAWWATKLCDVLGNNENQLRRGAVQGSVVSEQWYYWIFDRLASNTPYDDLIEGIVLAKSRNSEQGFEEYCRHMSDLAQQPRSYGKQDTLPYYWARNNMRKPNEKALSFSYAFLGVRLQCAECHKHPFDQWSQQDFQQFTAFFNRIEYGMPDRTKAEEMYAAIGLDKKLPNNERQKLIAKAVKEGKTVPFDEVYLRSVASARRKSDSNATASAGRVITPKVLGGEAVVDASYDDPRQPLMDWLRQKDNPYFARAFVNRVWAGYFNVGIVEPPDDMNLANAPSNKDLLDYLAAEFIAHDYDIKWLHRTIVGSRTYQLSWQTNASNELDQKNYSHAIPRRLPAEVVYDAVVAATGSSQEQARRSEDPTVECAIGLGRGYTQRVGGTGNTSSSYALGVFGKPKRETPCDCERSSEPSLLQTVYLHNDREVFTMIDRKTGWLSEAVRRWPGAAGETAAVDPEAEKKAKRDKKSEIVTPSTPAEIIREAYLRTFNRNPSETEIAIAEKYVADSADVGSGLRDLMWALLNAKEFLVNH